MPMSLEDWDEMVGRHLHMIEAGAEICERHAKQLFEMPEFETRCREYLPRVIRVLERSVVRIANAQQEMDRKDKKRGVRRTGP